jgi:hypothetical protein
MTPSFVVATLALVVAAATGVATAAPLIKGSQIAKSSITTKHIKDSTIQTTDISAKAQRALRGRTGAAGQDGVSGYEIVSGDSDASQAEDDWIHVSVSCPDGKKALGSSVEWVYVGNDAYGPSVHYRSLSTATLLPDGSGYWFRGSPVFSEFKLRGKVTCATLN